MNIINATPHHAIRIHRQGLREVDIKEWRLGSGEENTYTSIRTAMQVSAVCRVAYSREGLIVALWGVTSAGCVWLIASTHAEGRAGVELHRHWKEELKLLQHHAHPHKLWAYPYLRNELHLKWLRLLGFKPVGRLSPEGFKLFKRRDYV